jgi:hypothetical protein
MSNESVTDDPVLPVEPGLCGLCRHALLRQTRRGTTYLRCARAEWDERLVRYPRLPVRDCPGFEERP